MPLTEIEKQIAELQLTVCQLQTRQRVNTWLLTTITTSLLALAFFVLQTELGMFSR